MGKCKHDEGNYCQVWRNGIKILNTHNKKVPYSTRWLYAHLHELEHALTSVKNKERDYFFRFNDQLREDTGMGRHQVTKGIKILRELGLIETWRMPVRYEDTGKKSTWHKNHFRLLEPEAIAPKEGC